MTDASTDPICQAKGCETPSVTVFGDGEGKGWALCEEHGDLLAVGFETKLPAGPPLDDSVSDLIERLERESIEVAPWDLKRLLIDAAQAIAGLRDRGNVLAHHLNVLCEENWENRYGERKYPCAYCYEAVEVWRKGLER